MNYFTQLTCNSVTTNQQRPLRLAYSAVLEFLWFISLLQHWREWRSHRAQVCRSRCSRRRWRFDSHITGINICCSHIGHIHSLLSNWEVIVNHVAVIHLRRTVSGCWTHVNETAEFGRCDRRRLVLSDRYSGGCVDVRKPAVINCADWCLRDNRLTDPALGWRARGVQRLSEEKWDRNTRGGFLLFL